MATYQVEQVLDRLARDTAFRARYCSDPDRTLSEFLTREEIRLLKAGDNYTGCDPDGTARLQALSAALCGADPGP